MKIENMHPVFFNFIKVGDNCDIKVVTGNQASDKQDEDLHYFGLMLVFPRIADCAANLSTARPRMNLAALTVDKFVLTCEQERLQVLNSYKVLLGRLLADKIPALK